MNKYIWEHDNKINKIITSIIVIIGYLLDTGICIYEILHENIVAKLFFVIALIAFTYLSISLLKEIKNA